MKSKSAFALLLGRRSTARQRERLYQVRNQLGIGENDALWGLVEVIEEYCATLEHRTAHKLERPQAGPAVSQIHWSTIAWTLGMALQAFLMAAAFEAGARSRAAPVATWLANHSWVSLVLRVPAGWLIFSFLLPTLLYGVHLGWRARLAEQSVGWVLMGSFGTAAAVLAATFWWLVQQ